MTDDFRTTRPPTPGADTGTAGNASGGSSDAETRESTGPWADTAGGTSASTGPGGTIAGSDARPTTSGSESSAGAEPGLTPHDQPAEGGREEAGEGEGAEMAEQPGDDAG